MAEPDWKDICVRLADAVRPTACASKNAVIAKLLTEVTDAIKSDIL